MLHDIYIYIYQYQYNSNLFDKQCNIVGYSRSVAEAFWLGFPTDWKQLIDEHFHNHNYSR